jgi:DNA-binding response OmpR family regulator
MNLSRELRARLEALTVTQRRALTTALQRVAAKGFDLDLDENDFHTILDEITAPTPPTQLEILEALSPTELDTLARTFEFDAWGNALPTGRPVNIEDFDLDAIFDRIIANRARDAADPNSDVYHP